jgi:hypothetical protein
MKDAATNCSPLHPGGGEGLFAQLSQYRSENSRKIVHHFVIPEAQYAIAAALKLFGARSVRRVFVRVLSAVELDRELFSRTGEIDDARTEGMLVAKTPLD